MEVPKSLMRKKSKAKRQLIQTSYIKRIKFFLFANYSEHLINQA